MQSYFKKKKKNRNFKQYTYIHTHKTFIFIFLFYNTFKYKGYVVFSKKDAKFYLYVIKAALVVFIFNFVIICKV